MRPAAIERAERAIAGAEPNLASPFAAAEIRVRRELGLPVPKHEDILTFWEARQPGSRLGDDRYRWEVSHKRCKPAAYVPKEEEWHLFRPDLERDGDRVELTLSLPISIAEHALLLDRMAAEGGEIAARARAIEREALPLFRRDLASRIATAHPWIDTFTLLCLVRHDRVLEELGPIALAIATSYAALAEDGFLAGFRYPYHDRPLVSASAQLATGLLRLGVELPVLGKLATFVAGARLPVGAWGDEPTATKHRKESLLTTLACAELLVRVDPGFDAEPTLRFLEGEQKPTGFFVEYGPELVWLTGQVLSLARVSKLAFAERFSFPHAASVNLDRKTALPSFAYFDDLCQLFAALPSVSATDTDLAFIDLAGFGAFNNSCGQEMGDLVLGEFARAIEELPGARAVRDGGDEFLVIGAPTRTGLEADMDQLRRAWPDRFRARFPGSPVVSPRVVLVRARSSELRGAREALGKRISDVKSRHKQPPPEGVLERL